MPRGMMQKRAPATGGVQAGCTAPSRMRGMCGVAGRMRVVAGWLQGTVELLDVLLGLVAREDDAARVGEELGEPLSQLVRPLHPAALRIAQRRHEPACAQRVAAWVECAGLQPGTHRIAAWVHTAWMHRAAAWDCTELQPGCRGVGGDGPAAEDSQELTAVPGLGVLQRLDAELAGHDDVVAVPEVLGLQHTGRQGWARGAARQVRCFGLAMAAGPQPPQRCMHRGACVRACVQPRRVHPPVCLPRPRQRSPARAACARSVRCPPRCRT